MAAFRVFISSTFRDMTQERDGCHTKVFPALRRECSKNGMVFNEVDMRWGIHANTINTCLKEVQRSQYIVILLGDRYGWVPSKSDLEDAVQRAKNDLKCHELDWIMEHQGKSMTHLEIIQGIDRVPEEDRKALVYIRTHTPQDVAQEVSDQEPESSKTLLKHLKTHLQSLPGVTCCMYDEPAELADKVMGDLKRLVNQAANKLASHSSTSANAHTVHAQTNQACYALAPSLERLRNDVLGDNVREPIAITGESGCGKSSLMAHMLLHWLHAPNHEAFVHFTGLAGPNHLYTTVLHRLLTQLKDWSQGQISDPIPADPKEMTPKVFEWVHTVASANPDKEYAFFLDATNQLLDMDSAHTLRWLPMVWPPNCRLIVTSIETPPLWRFAVKKFPELCAEDRQQMLDSYLGLAGKEMLPEQSQLIVESRHIRSPLHLRVILDELRITGLFDRLTEDIKSLVAAETVSAVFEKVLARWESAYNSLATPASWLYTPLTRTANEVCSPSDWQLVGAILSLICCAPLGIMEHELWGILKVEQAAVMPLFHALSEIIDSSSGLVKFAHNAFSEAVKVRYVHQYGEQRVQGALAAYFTCLPMDDERKATMLPDYLLSLGDVDGTAQFLSHPTVFKRQCDEAESVERQRLWRQIPTECATEWLERMLEDMLSDFVKRTAINAGAGSASQADAAAEDPIEFEPEVHVTPVLKGSAWHVTAKGDRSRRPSKYRRKVSRRLGRTTSLQHAPLLEPFAVELVQNVRNVGSLLHHLGAYKPARTFLKWALSICVNGACHKQHAHKPLHELMERATALFGPNARASQDSHTLTSRSSQTIETTEAAALPITTASVIHCLAQLAIHLAETEEAQHSLQVAMEIYTAWSSDMDDYVVMLAARAWTLITQNRLRGEEGAICLLKQGIILLSPVVLKELGMDAQDLPTRTDKLEENWHGLLDGMELLCKQGKHQLLNPRVLPLVNRFAIAMSRTQRMGVGQRLFHISLVMHQSVLGTTHPLVATVLGDMSKRAKEQAFNLHRQHKRNAEIANYAPRMKSLLETARTHLEQALALRKQVLGEEHPFVATLYLQMGDLCCLEERYEEALSNFQQCYELRLATLGADNPQTKRAFRRFRQQEKSMSHHTREAKGLGKQQQEESGDKTEEQSKARGGKRKGNRGKDKQKQEGKGKPRKLHIVKQAQEQSSEANV
eukprot:m.324374 g.324374  ORF g.324374 m.324374 type:complete len:1189 (-) comp16009_c0_seq3:324-3890(-)